MSRRPVVQCAHPEACEPCRGDREATDGDRAGNAGRAGRADGAVGGKAGVQQFSGCSGSAGAAGAAGPAKGREERPAGRPGKARGPGRRQVLSGRPRGRRPPGPCHAPRPCIGDASGRWGARRRERHRALRGCPVTGGTGPPGAVRSARPPGAARRSGTPGAACRTGTFSRWPSRRPRGCWRGRDPGR